jgi:hypothetical protein
MRDEEWAADKKTKRDKAERERAATTDPKKERSSRATRDRYEAMLTIGRDRMRDIAAKAAESRRNPSANDRP